MVIGDLTAQYGNNMKGDRAGFPDKVGKKLESQGVLENTEHAADPVPDAYAKKVAEQNSQLDRDLAARMSGKAGK